MRCGCQHGSTLVPKIHQNRVLEASWKRLGASGARLGCLLERLGRVLERLGLMWERPVGVLVRLGASSSVWSASSDVQGAFRRKLC